MALEFNYEFVSGAGFPVAEADGVYRLTANNPGPFTFHGTNTYLIGTGTLAIIDPGPADDTQHYQALIDAIGGRPVSHILVTHTHVDHSPLARILQKETGAIIAGCGPHRSARPLAIGEINPLDSSADMLHTPDLQLEDGTRIEGDGWSLCSVFTPGHTANHLSFFLEQEKILFSGDHVMAWSTSIVAPPDGSMSDYMASLDKLMQREDRFYLPGHGGPVKDPLDHVQKLKAHRLMREQAIVERINKGDRTVSELVAAIYRDIDPKLHGAAGLSVLAHLEDLVARGQIVGEEPPAIDGVYLPG